MIATDLYYKKTSTGHSTKTINKYMLVAVGNLLSAYITNVSASRAVTSLSSWVHKIFFFFFLSIFHEKISSHSSFTELHQIFAWEG